MKNPSLCCILKISFAFKKLLLLHSSSFKSCYFFVPYWILFHKAAFLGAGKKHYFSDAIKFGAKISRAIR